MIFDIRFECWNLVLYSIFNIRLDVVLSLIFDIRHSKFECEIEFDIRYSTFDLNVGFSLIFDIRHELNVGFSLIFDIRHSI